MKHLFNFFSRLHKEHEQEPPMIAYKVSMHYGLGHPNEYGVTVSAHNEEEAKQEAAATIAHIGWFPGKRSEEEIASKMIFDSVTIIE